MPRTHVVMRGHRFRGPAYRALSQGAQWLYQHLHFEADLTMLGSLTMTVNRWALGARGLDVNEINRELGELEQAGFILMDSCTQELFIADFLAGRPPFRHRNHLVGALNIIESIESEPLRVALYERSLPLIEDAMKRFDRGLASPLDRPPADPPNRPLDSPLASPMPGDRDGEGDGDRDLAVCSAFWQQCATPDLDGEYPDSIKLRERVQGATEELARRRTAEAPLNRELAVVLDEQWLRWGERLAHLAESYPSWSARELANAIDRGRFGD